MICNTIAGLEVTTASDLFKYDDPPPTLALYVWFDLVSSMEVSSGFGRVRIRYRHRSRLGRNKCIEYRYLPALRYVPADHLTGLECQKS